MYESKGEEAIDLEMTSVVFAITREGASEITREGASENWALLS